MVEDGSSLSDVSLLPLKPGDHIWRAAPGGGTWHALYVGQFLLGPDEQERIVLSLPDADAIQCLPHSVVVVTANQVARISLDEFVSSDNEDVDCKDSPALIRPEAADSCLACGSDDSISADIVGDDAGAADADMDAEPPDGDLTTQGSSSGEMVIEGNFREEGPNEHAGPVHRQLKRQRAIVRLYTRRPRSRRAAIVRALEVTGTRVDCAALTAFPELLPWWAIFDETDILQPGLCATRARALRFRLTPRGDTPVQPTLLWAILAGGAVVRKGRVVLRGVKLMKALRLTRAAGAGWAGLGGFVGQTIAASILDDGSTGTSVATAAGGWAGGLAGSSVAAAAASTMGVEALGGGSVAGGLVVCSSLSAAGAIAGAGLAAYAAKRALDGPNRRDRTSEYHDCPLRLVGDADDVFKLFDATLEFPPEDGSTEDANGTGIAEGRLSAVAWYAVGVSSSTPADPDGSGSDNRTD